MMLVLYFICFSIYLPVAAHGMVLNTMRYPENTNNTQNVREKLYSVILTCTEAGGTFLDSVLWLVKLVEVCTHYVVSQLAANGFNVGSWTNAVMNTVNIVGLCITGLQILKTVYGILKRWINENQAPSISTIGKLVRSIWEFRRDLRNFKTCSKIVEESQKQTLQNHWKSLNNKHDRNTFKKLYKETSALHKDMVQRRAEIISAIRNNTNTNKAFKWW